MSWMPYYVEVSRRQREEEMRRRLAHPRPVLEPLPKQRSESWRRLWGRPWTRALGRRRAGHAVSREQGAGRSAGQVTTAGR